MSTIQTRFQTAQTHHQNHQFSEAENIYQSILADQPDHADSHHFLGLLYLQTRRPKAQTGPPTAPQSFRPGLSPATLWS